jgi:hypothetical protein
MKIAVRLITHPTNLYINTQSSVSKGSALAMTYTLAILFEKGKKFTVLAERF